LKLSAALYRAADKVVNRLISERGFKNLNTEEQALCQALFAMREEVK